MEIQHSPINPEEIKAVKIRPFRYGNAYEDYVLISYDVLKSDRFGMEIHFICFFLFWWWVHFC